MDSIARTRGSRVFQMVACLVALAPGVFAQPCQSTWSDAFPPGEVLGQPAAMAVFSDATGDKLVVAGPTKAGGLDVARIAQWDGTRWAVLGSGIEEMEVLAVASAEPGGTAALFAGGTFNKAGGQAAFNIARWSGTEWSALGKSVNGTVHALTALEDTSGPVLVAAGAFNFAGNLPAGRIARWNGSAWSPLALGLGANNTVRALVAMPGAGPQELYAAGEFTTIDNQPAQGLARWTGSAWVPQGGGLVPGPTAPTVAFRALEAFPAGSGSVCVAGSFAWTSPSGTTCQSVLRWDGTGWNTLGTGIEGTVLALEASEIDGVPRLYAAGWFTKLASGLTMKALVSWDGTEWSTVGSGLGLAPGDAVGTALLHTSLNGVPRLFVGGTFQNLSNLPIKYLAGWTGTNWEPLGSGLNETALCLVRHDEPNANGIYVGGQFRIAGSAAANYVARWDGEQWHDLAGGTDKPVHALAASDIDGQPALYVGGQFTQPAARIARWRDAEWSPLAQGVNGNVYAISEFQGPSGLRLIAGGSFTIAGTTSANRVAAWNASTWSKLGTGVNNGVNGDVRALKPFDNGSGPALYVAGAFTSAAGVPASRVARWDGAAWTGVGTLDQGDALCLEVFDDGSGPALFAGGSFLVAEGAFAKRLVRLGPTGWKEVGSGLLGVVTGLTAADLPEGPRLIVTGGFLENGAQMPLFSRGAWDGKVWNTIAQASQGEAGGAAVSLYRDSAPMQGLYFAGGFDSIGGVPAGRFARADLCAMCEADCDQDAALTIDDFICFQTRFAVADPKADCDASGTLDIDDFICFQTLFAIGC